MYLVTTAQSKIQVLGHQFRRLVLSRVDKRLEAFLDNVQGELRAMEAFGDHLIHSMFELQKFLHHGFVTRRVHH
jgi:hypothetical protein